MEPTRWQLRALSTPKYTRTCHAGEGESVEYHTDPRHFTSFLIEFSLQAMAFGNTTKDGKGQSLEMMFRLPYQTTEGWTKQLKLDGVMTLEVWSICYYGNNVAKHMLSSNITTDATPIDTVTSMESSAAGADDLSGDDLSGDDLSGDDLFGDDLSSDEEERMPAVQRIPMNISTVFPAVEFTDQQQFSSLTVTVPNMTWSGQSTVGMDGQAFSIVESTANETTTAAALINLAYQNRTDSKEQSTINTLADLLKRISPPPHPEAMDTDGGQGKVVNPNADGVLMMNVLMDVLRKIADHQLRTGIATRDMHHENIVVNRDKYWIVDFEHSFFAWNRITKKVVGLNDLYPEKKSIGKPIPMEHLQYIAILHDEQDKLFEDNMLSRHSDPPAIRLPYMDMDYKIKCKHEYKDPKLFLAGEGENKVSICDVAQQLVSQSGALEPNYLHDFLRADIITFISQADAKYKYECAYDLFERWDTVLAADTLEAYTQALRVMVSNETVATSTSS